MIGEHSGGGGELGWWRSIQVVGGTWVFVGEHKGGGALR